VDETQRRLWTEFRFAVIAPLVCRRLDEAERREIRRHILNTYFDAPDGERRLIAERTLRAWIARYRLHGFDGLKRIESRTAGAQSSIPEKLLQTAVDLRCELRSRSAKTILSILRAKGFDVSKVPRSTLNFQLNKRGATKERYASEKGTFQRFQKEHANDLWQADSSGGVWLPDPYNRGQTKMTRFISFIDDATRVVTHAQFFWDEQVPSLLDCFRKALLLRAKPRMIYTDNGPCYKSKAFASACAQLRIELRHAEQYTPEGKGKIERNIGTVKAGFYGEANRSGLTTLEDLNAFFAGWLEQEYHRCKHSALNMTPLERWQQDEEKGFTQPVEPEAIRRALMLRETRKVNKRTALIQLENRMYQAGAELAGKKVEVLWQADREVDEVEVWYGGKLVQTAVAIAPGSNIDYSKRPQRERGPEVPSVLASSKEYRLALSSDHRSVPLTTGGDYLAQSEFEKLFSRILDREWTEEDRAYLGGVFAELSPAREDFVESVLQKAAGVIGTGLHLRSYCDLLKQERLSKRR